MLLIDSLYVGLQSVGRGYKLLNPGLTFKIIGIIQEIMRKILFIQLNMLTWLINQACLVIQKLCWCCWRRISHSWALRTRIGVCRLLEIGMLNPDIIRNNSKRISTIMI
jgi:hypothetical protein